MDDRFARVVTDPRFRTLRRSDKKVKVDQRFERMFTEKKFKLKSSVDKRGKQKKSNDSDEYKKFYDLSDSEKKSEKEVSSESESNEQIEGKILKKPKIPNARGKTDSDSDSDQTSSSSESEDDSDEDEEVDHKWYEWDRDVPQTEAPTKRLAVCNIDWDRISAKDLYVLINSFKPSGASILSVRIYPSELGLQRMKTEAESGPIGLIKQNKEEIQTKSNDKRNKDINEVDEEDEEMDAKTTEYLRQYELTRLQYFYAVVECDSEATAEVLYGELDGMEYESSSATLDLRFIPEDMAFEEQPKSECFSMPDLSAYKAPQFVNCALQQSKVRMTWDQTDPKRKDVFDRAFNKEDDDDLKAYLASSDDEEEDDEQEMPDLSDETGLQTKDKINKYKELLNGLNEPKEEEKSEGNMEMEISWEPNLKDMTTDLITRKEREKNNSTFEQNYIKKKEKRKEEKVNEMSEESDDKESDEKPVSRQKKSKKNGKNVKTDPNLELLFLESETDNRKHFNYKNIVENENQRKRKEKTNDDFKFNAEDDRFGALYTSHHYNVDPSDPHFKKTEAFNEIISRSTKRIKQSNDSLNNNSINVNNDSSKSSWKQLVRTVKTKTQMIYNINNNKQKQMNVKQNKFKS